MKRTLSSMKFAFITLICLIGWFITGMLLTYAGGPKPVLKAMNNEMLYDWFFGTAQRSLPAMLWFVIFCAIAGLLLLSICFCTYNTLYKAVRNKLNTRSLLLFGIHLNFIFIIIFHIINALSGFKNGDLELAQGNRFDDKSGFSIVIDKINFADDINILIKQEKGSRRSNMGADFSHTENYAEVSLYNNDKLLSSGKVFILSPFVYKDFRFTIEKFVPIETDGKMQAGISSIFVRNSYTGFFFIFYAIEILLIFIFAVISWKRTDNRG